MRKLICCEKLGLTYVAGAGVLSHYGEVAKDGGTVPICFWNINDGIVLLSSWLSFLFFIQDFKS